MTMAIFERPGRAMAHRFGAGTDAFDRFTNTHRRVPNRTECHGMMLGRGIVLPSVAERRFVAEPSAPARS